MAEYENGMDEGLGMDDVKGPYTKKLVRRANKQRFVALVEAFFSASWRFARPAARLLCSWWLIYFAAICF